MSEYALKLFNPIFRILGDISDFRFFEDGFVGVSFFSQAAWEAGDLRIELELGDSTVPVFPVVESSVEWAGRSGDNDWFRSAVHSVEKP